MRVVRLTVAVSVLSMCGCATVTAPESSIPAWLGDMIATFQKLPVGNPPQSIWRYTYRGQTVYYIPQQCCDQFGLLLDVKGVYLCAPDGGIGGHGDSRCPDFYQERMDEVLIWRDSRTW